MRARTTTPAALIAALIAGWSAPADARTCVPEVARLQLEVPTGRCLASPQASPQPQPPHVIVGPPVAPAPPPVAPSYAGYGAPPAPFLPGFAPPAALPAAPRYQLVEEERDLRALWIPGLALLAGAYLGDVLISEAALGGSDVATLAYVPLVGPWLQLGADPTMQSLSRSSLIVNGLAQVAGAAMLVAGLAIRRTVQVRRRVSIELEGRTVPGGGVVGVRGAF